MSEEALHLDPSNLLWLKARAIALGHRSLSDVLNELLAKMRREDRQADLESSEEAVAVISPDDPDLSGADAALRQLFAESYARSASGLSESRER